MANNHSNSNSVLDTTSLAAIAEAVKPYPLSDERKDAMRSRLLARLDAPAPPGTRTIRAAKMAWINISPLVEVKILRRDIEQRNQTVLVRLQPGGSLPSHSHTQQEECLVLEGEIRVGDHYARQGDVHIAEAGCRHGDIITDNGALLLIRSEIHELPAT